MNTEAEGRELSLRAIVLGVTLSAILSGANAYLGLFAGMTVSASIPAAVISMGLLRAFGGSLLENNQVQTAASAGESAAAGAIFTLPAMILLGAWAQFDLLLCGVLIALGGVLGVLFTILLRRALVVPDDLPFPEGAATAEVLQVGHGRATSQQDQRAEGALKALVLGAIFGAVAKFVQAGLAWSKATVEGASVLSGKTFYWGFGVSPALTAVGYIVGVEVAWVVFVGGAVNWAFVLPFVAEASEGQSALDVAWTTWSQKTRYLGVGAMTVGGIGALFQVRQAIAAAVKAGWTALRGASQSSSDVPLHDRDLPPRLVLGVIGLSVIPLTLVFGHLTGQWGVALVLAGLVIVFGFLFSSVAAYMAGLVGSSNNPVSGVTIATILFTSLLLSAWGVTAVAPGLGAAAGPAAAILVGSVVCTAAAIGGDNVQDLRAGQILGATPYRQQIMQLIGVGVAAVVLGPVLGLLMNAYGFGAPTPEHPQALRAPQATLMASVAEGVFGGSLPWGFFLAGAMLGLSAWGVDWGLRKKEARVRFPVLAFALGLYLPWEMSVPVLLGGLMSRRSTPGEGRPGVLAGAGLITGEALMGIVLAVLVTVGGGLKALQNWNPDVPQVLAIATLFGALFLLRSVGRSERVTSKASREG